MPPSQLSQGKECKFCHRRRKLNVTMNEEDVIPITIIRMWCKSGGILNRWRIFSVCWRWRSSILERASNGHDKVAREEKRLDGEGWVSSPLALDCIARPFPVVSPFLFNSADTQLEGEGLSVREVSLWASYSFCERLVGSNNIFWGPNRKNLTRIRSPRSSTVTYNNFTSGDLRLRNKQYYPTINIKATLAMQSEPGQRYQY